jgi:hypothetical protein
MFCAEYGELCCSGCRGVLAPGSPPNAARRGVESAPEMAQAYVETDGIPAPGVGGLALLDDGGPGSSAGSATEIARAYVDTDGNPGVGGVDDGGPGDGPCCACASPIRRRAGKNDGAMFRPGEKNVRGHHYRHNAYSGFERGD